MAHLRAAVVAGFVCAVALSPVLYAMRSPMAGRPWRGPRRVVAQQCARRGRRRVAHAEPVPPAVGQRHRRLALESAERPRREHRVDLVGGARGDRVRDRAETLSRAGRVVGVHGTLRVALARSVHSSRRYQHLCAHAVGGASISAGRRRGADANAHDRAGDDGPLDAPGFCRRPSPAALAAPTRRRCRDRGGAGVRAAAVTPSAVFGGDSQRLSRSSPPTRVRSASSISRSA